MYLIALATEKLAFWDGADRVPWTGLWRRHSYEGNSGIEDGPTDLHRQMDAEDIVFA
jgi:hypothetical protein